MSSSLRPWLFLVLAAACSRDAPAVAVDGGTPGQCGDDATAAGSCVVGHCSLSAPRGTVPAGVAIGLAEMPVPADLAGDALGASVCAVSIPAGTTFAGELTLAIATGGGPDPAAALFVRDVDGARLVASSAPGAGRVAGLIQSGGIYGVTHRPGAPVLTDVVGVDVSAAATAADVLRNEAAQGVQAARWDGTHLFVGNGTRLLVWDGLPATPGTPPARVLGQPGVTMRAPGTSSSVFDGLVGGVWSDGTRLAVATGNRVLVWNAMPAASFVPADLVLGQPDFSTDGPNTGGVAATSLDRPTTLDSDGTRFLVADTLNHRVLVWSAFPTEFDQPADVVIGQPTMASNVIKGGATPLYQAWGAAFAPTGAYVAGLFGAGLMHVPSVAASNPAPDFTVVTQANQVQPGTVGLPAMMTRVGDGLAVRDVFGARIAFWKTLPTGGGATIDVVLGQPDATRSVSSPTNASTIAGGGYSLGGGNGWLLVPDDARLLVWDHAPAYHYEPATAVLGQAGFTTNTRDLDYRGTGAGTVADPSDVAAAAGVLAVADRSNNRVLLVRAGAPTVILGQPDEHSYVPNVDQHHPSAATMSGPAGVALDGTHLVVADSENHRVLVWNSVPTKTGTPADVVLGQADFASVRPNHGRGDADGDGFSDAGADGFFYPIGVASDGTHLVVADRLNHRVLAWTTFPTKNGQPADVVVGQTKMSDNQPNHGRGAYAHGPDGFDLPTGVALVGTTLWVADTENNRVLRWDHALDGTAAATAVLGQPDTSTVSNPNFQPSNATGAPLAQPTTATSVLRPRGVVVAGGRIYVSESDSNRVHMFDATSLTPLGELGQASDSVGTADTGGIGAATLAGPLGIAVDASNVLWVADAQNQRLLGFDVTTAPSTGAAARSVLGQASMMASGFDQSTTATGSVTAKPRGLWRDGSELVVADTDHHRVLVLDAPPQPGAVPSVVYGQPDDSLALPNAGLSSPTARTMLAPRGVWADDGHLVVADTGNDRVLVFDRSGKPDAIAVLGQADMTSGGANRGGAPSASTLAAPGGVFVDGAGRLYVADTGNHRVLVWKTLPVSGAGVPSDFVLGQADGAHVSSNRGGASPDAGTMSSPAAVLVDTGALYVADAGNNRVLRFKVDALATGAAADTVIGQPDATTRTAASTATDLAHLSGPAALASDGVTLFVVDRDLGRVVEVGLSDGKPVASLGGDAGLVTLMGPGGIAVEKTPLFTSRLYVADTFADRIVQLDSISRLK